MQTKWKVPERSPQAKGVCVRLRYFPSNKNSGWLTAARSNSSIEDATVTPK
jgi:hypothetical protein